MQLNALCKNRPVLITDEPGKLLLTHIRGLKISRQTLLCMKITAFLLLIFCMQVSATTLAQNVSLSEHNASLEKVINDIKQQTGYSFFYNQEWLSQAQPVDIDVRNQPLEAALKTCFNNQPFTYAIVNQTIVLKLKENSDNTPIQPQKPVTITGRVTDTVGTPLIGATIAIKKTGKAVITDDKGEFSIIANSGDVVACSYIGYNSYEFTLNDNAPPFVTIMLHPRTNGLKEVVVNNGYQKMSLQTTTGSFATVDNQLFNRETGANVLNRLEGIVPGLLFNKNVPASAGIDISIRGTSTLFSNTQPLIVVDNFPYDGDIQNINPNDVENVTILKDAAASAIWGARSGNGVIVITTKKGKRNQPLSIEFNANVTVGDKPNLFYSPNFIDSKDFISVEKSLFDAGYYDSQLSDPKHPVVSPVVQILANQRAGTISSSQGNSEINSFENLDVRNDLTKYFLRKSIDQQYNLNFRGGSVRDDYFYSFGYDGHLDNQVGNDNNRITVNGNNNFYPFKNLVINTQIVYTRTKADNNGQLGNLSEGQNYSYNPYPYAQLADKNGNALAIPKDFNPAWVTNPTAQAGLLDWQFRPLDELQNADNTGTASDFQLKTGIGYSFFKGFKAEIKYSFENSEANNGNYFSQQTYYTRNLINEYTDFTASNAQGTQYPIPLGGIYNSSNSSVISNHLRGQLSYDNNWNSKHQLSALAGAEIADTKGGYSANATAYGYDKTSENYTTVDFANSYLEQPYGFGNRIPDAQEYYYTDNRFISYFGTLQYSYFNRYGITGSLRIDKSNLFGVNANQKAVPLNTAGIFWEPSSEGFYKIDWLPLLKIRISHGNSGNVNTSASALTTITTLSGSRYFNLPFAQITFPGNPDLKWEKDAVTNLGIDFGVKNNLITGSFDYYFRKATDLYGTSSLPPSTGNATIYGNVAATKGHGFELVLNFSMIRSSNFSWTSNFLLSESIDEVTKWNAQSGAGTYLLGDASAGSIAPSVGKPVFAIYSYKSAGLTHETGDPQGYLNGQLSTNYGEIISHDNSVDSLKLWGSARPTTYGSFRNTFTYKAFSFSANVIYKLNYYFRKSMLGYNSLFTDWEMNNQFAKRWMQPGDELKTSVPSMPSLTNLDGNRDAFYSFSETSVDKGDHIRLQDLTLSYNIKSPKLFQHAFKSINIYCVASNIAILWRANHDHLDPDLYTQSSFLSGYPTPRTISFGFRGNL